MHIVYLTNEYPYKDMAHGGIGTFVQNLARNLVKKGVNVSVIGITNSTKNVGTQLDEGVKIYRIKQSTAKFGKFFFNSLRIKKKIKKINKILAVDIVEGSELSFAFLPKKTPYKKVIRMHGGHHFFAKELGRKLSFWRAFQEKASFFKADEFIAVSNYVGMKTREYLNMNFNYIRIFNTVNFLKFHKANNLKIKKNSLLFVGTICEKKGIRQLVQAMPIVKEIFPTVELIIVGRDWYFSNNESYSEYLKTFIPKDMEESIKIIGVIPHDEIPRIIEKAEICVYPSHMEAMPITLLEAMLMGKPIIAGNIGPSREAIEDNITGLLVDPYSPKKIADKIISLLSDKRKAILIGESARKVIIEKFNHDKIFNQNINFYKSIL